MPRVSGAFDVQVKPLGALHDGGDQLLSRMSIDKQFHGALDATSRGEMLSARTSITDSAAYVAIEKVTGSLDGRAGTFVLQHTATMTRGVPQLTITVAPDSGTGALTGLTGTMGIRIDGGAHAYDFDYQLPA